MTYGKSNLQAPTDVGGDGGLIYEMSGLGRFGGLSRSSRRSRCLDPWGIPPEPLQIVFLPNIRPHDVHHDVKVVEDQPGGLERAVDRPWPETVLLFDGLG